MRLELSVSGFSSVTNIPSGHGFRQGPAGPVRVPGLRRGLSFLLAADARLPAASSRLTDTALLELPNARFLPYPGCSWARYRVSLRICKRTVRRAGPSPGSPVLLVPGKVGDSPAWVPVPVTARRHSRSALRSFSLCVRVAFSFQKVFLGYISKCLFSFRRWFPALLLRGPHSGLAAQPSCRPPPPRCPRPSSSSRPREPPRAVAAGLPVPPSPAGPSFPLLARHPRLSLLVLPLPLSLSLFPELL